MFLHDAYMVIQQLKLESVNPSDISNGDVIYSPMHGIVLVEKVPEVYGKYLEFDQEVASYDGYLT